MLPLPISELRTVGLTCDLILCRVAASFEPHLSAQLSLIKSLSPHVPVIAITVMDRRSTTAALDGGAFACWTEGSSIKELTALLRRASQFKMLEKSAEQMAGPMKGMPHTCRIVGGERIAALVATAARLAKSDVNVLITGESGTGKELFARLLHDAGPRAGLPFIAVSCASLPETLIESELFGHEKGAFTGASSAARGRFEEVGAGTLFLDEIGDLSPLMQLKLLRVLQERTFERLGSSRPIRCHARIVFATNQPLRKLTEAGRFRMDLYYRLNGVQLQLPPLRERPEDIRILAETFLAAVAARHSRTCPILSESTLDVLRHYTWPGNVRELQNAMEAVVALHETLVIEPWHLGAQICPTTGDLTISEDTTFELEVKAFKRRLIERTLIECGNNKQQAAKSLGMARSSLHRLIDELQIGPARSHHGDSVSSGFPIDLECPKVRTSTPVPVSNLRHSPRRLAS